jgi:hypothetical protein
MNFNPRVFHVDHPPNACNDENYKYFRLMSHKSHFFGGFGEHSDSKWFVDLKSKTLVRRHGQGSRKLDL